MIPVALLAVAGYLALMPVPSRRGSRPAAESRPGAAPAAGWRPRAVLTRGPSRSSSSAPAPMAVAQASPQRGTDHRAGHRRQRRAAELRSARLRAHRPGRPAGDPGEPARQGRAAHLPRPGLHVRLPADRAGVPGGRPGTRRPSSRNVELVASSPTRSIARSPTPGPSTARKASAGVPNWLFLTGSLAQLQQVVEELRRRGRGPAGRRHDRAQRHRLRHRRRRAYPDRAELRPGSRHRQLRQSSFAVELAATAQQVLRPT